MTDYIKRDDAIRSIADHDEFKGERWIKEAWADYMIEDAPTIDVAPVRHGHWVVIDAEEPRRYGCSECKRLSWHMENYCPNCGARMDGDDNETD